MNGQSCTSEFILSCQTPIQQNKYFKKMYGGGGFGYMPQGGMMMGQMMNPYDQQLMSQVQLVYMKYDMNRTGTLEGQQFFMGYQQLCRLMGIAPPTNYQSVMNAAMAADTNYDGRVDQMEMFNLFKKIQMMNGGMMGGGMNVSVGGMGMNVNMGGMGMGGGYGGMGHGGILLMEM